MGEMCTGVTEFTDSQWSFRPAAGIQDKPAFEKNLRCGVAANSFPHSFYCFDLSVCGPFRSQKIPFTPPAASV